jgi:putative tryptophan/tyrosine transport system substrate-binding protein
MPDVTVRSSKNAITRTARQGRNVAIEYRWAEGHIERFTEIAAEFLRLKVDVIVTFGAAVYAAKKATSTIPIVFPVATDPVGSGLVASLAHPGGNVTGLSTQSADLVGKRLGLLREMVPYIHRLAIIANAGGLPGSLLEMREAETKANTLGFSATTPEIRRAEDISPAFEAINGHVDALYVVIDPLIVTNNVTIGTLAFRASLPAIYPTREFVELGGLMSYGPNYPNAFRRTADLVDKILRGAKPRDIPVEQPSKFDLVINLNSAKTFGLNVSPQLLARADEVIE